MTARAEPEHPTSRGNLSAWEVAHPAFVLFFIIVFSVAGLMSYLSLGRAEDPSFTIKTMVISAAWPGATAEEMQDQVADKLEKRLQELELFDYVKTYTRPGVTVIQVQLKDTARAKEVDDAWYQVRKKLTDSRPTLPQGVQGPFFNDEYGDVYSAIYMLSGADVSLTKLKDYAEIVRQRLLRTEGVAKVDIVGVREQRIFIEFSHRKLATLGITPQPIFDSVARQNAVTPAGSIETNADRINVRVAGAFKGAAAIAEVPIEAGGVTFRLGDIATVNRGYEDPPSSIVRHNGSEAVGVVVAMTKGANVLELGKRLKDAIADAKAQVPTGVEIDQITDQPRVVEESVGEFLRSFVEALTIVLVVSFISLGWRSGLVVATSVPLVLAVVFVLMNVAGLNLDRVTLGSLIIALGLLVDDAIIAVEMMVVKMEQGWNRMRAAAFAWDSTAFPMLTGTLVTASGFLPVAIAHSTAGEYAGNIFWIVGLALVVSWIVAVFFTPYIGVKLLPNFAKNRGGHAGHDIYDTRLYRILRRAVGWAVRFRWVVIALTLAAFGAGVAAFAQVQQQFFPISSRPELFIEIRMPEGTSIGVTEAAAKKAEALIKDDPDLEYYTTYIGAGSPRFFLALNPVLPNESFALIVMMTKGAEARERLKARLDGLVARNVIPEARLRIDRLNFGPPIGFPVQFRVIGPGSDSVRTIADKVRTAMRANPNTRDVQFDWNEQKKSIRLEVDQDRARSLGLTPQDIAQTLGTLLSGYTVTEYKEGIELVPVVARAIPEERLGLGSFEDLTIPTRSGAAVPISQVARVHYEFEEPILWRQSGCGADCALGHRAHCSGAGRDGTDQTRDRRDRSHTAARYAHRGRRRGGRERQGQRRTVQDLPAHVPGHADHPDGTAAQVLDAVPGVIDRAAGPHRCEFLAACVRCSVRLQCAPRAHRARRHDHAQHRHSRRSDRCGRGDRSLAMGCDHHIDRAALAAAGAHGDGRHPGHDPAVAFGVLGTDGHHDDGRTLGGNDSDASLPSGSLCSLVPSTQTRSEMGRSSRVAASSSINALTSGGRHFRLNEGLGAGRIHLC